MINDSKFWKSSFQVLQLGKKTAYELPLASTLSKVGIKFRKSSDFKNPYYLYANSVT